MIIEKIIVVGVLAFAIYTIYVWTCNYLKNQCPATSMLFLTFAWIPPAILLGIIYLTISY